MGYKGHWQFHPDGTLELQFPPNSPLPFPRFHINRSSNSPSCIPLANSSHPHLPTPSTLPLHKCQAPVIASNPSGLGSSHRTKDSLCRIASVSVSTQARSPSLRHLLRPTLAIPFHRAKRYMLQHLSGIPYLFAHRQMCVSMAVHDRTLKSTNTSRRCWSRHLP
jgi:hypothetical protein